MLHCNNVTGTLCAISFDSVTFTDLEYFLQTNHGVKLERIDPDCFLNSVPDPSTNYMNLVTKFPLRKTITEFFEKYQCNRFSYSVDSVHTVDFSQCNGTFLYPNVCVYPSTTIGHDTILHTNTVIAHGTKMGPGCFVSIGVVICGSANVGQHCWIGAQTTVIDQINIADNTTIAAGSVIHKNITKPGMRFINGTLQPS
jgi:acetyltransferase-like isoleucine patch superfamily enzyme